MKRRSEKLWRPMNHKHAELFCFFFLDGPTNQQQLMMTYRLITVYYEEAFITVDQSLTEE